MHELLAQRFGVLAIDFLRRQASDLKPRAPVMLPETARVGEAIAALKAHKIGCVLVTDTDGRLSGIFSERDCVLKVFGVFEDPATVLLREVMTRDPVAGGPEITAAYVLNLMSQGGFRHIPLVDQGLRPVGILSVKDILDGIARECLDELKPGAET